MNNKGLYKIFKKYFLIDKYFLKYIFIILIILINVIKSILFINLLM